jgi:hypothetical protein
VRKEVTGISARSRGGDGDYDGGGVVEDNDEDDEEW